MATSRLEIKLDSDIKAKAEKASALLGRKSLTDYLVRLIDQDATQVIAEHSNIVLREDIFDKFMLACHTLEQPNQALVNALAFSKKKGFK